jgi:hypothetical protein
MTLPASAQHPNVDSRELSTVQQGTCWTHRHSDTWQGRVLDVVGDIAHISIFTDCDFRGVGTLAVTTIIRNYRPAASITRLS